MTKQVMHRTARDNEYLHRDFHGALSAAIQYLDDRYGAEAVREYLWQFARAFYAPLIEQVQVRGLDALEEHFRRLYAIEGGDVHFVRSQDELRIEVARCPAVAHMRQRGYRVADRFYETTATVNRALCDGTPFAAELLDYDAETGAGIQRFYKREKK